MINQRFISVYLKQLSNIIPTNFCWLFHVVVAVGHILWADCCLSFLGATSIFTSPWLLLHVASIFSKSNIPSKILKIHQQFFPFSSNPSNSIINDPIFPSFFERGSPPDPEPPWNSRSSTPPGGGGALRVAGTGGEGTAADGRGD